MRIHMLFSPPKGLAVTGEVLSIDADAKRISVKEEAATVPHVFEVRERGLLEMVSSGDWVKIDSADSKMVDSLSKL